MATTYEAIQLIRGATGPLGDFRMPILIQNLKRSGLAFSLPEETLRIILSRYKEHITFWGINSKVVTRELRELANALSMSELQISYDYENIAATYWRQFIPHYRPPNSYRTNGQPRT